MAFKSWLSRFLITRAARAYGFMDPVNLMGKIRGFSQPSEVAEPLELLRAGMIFHARGLVNTKAIQNNLDWVWPYWVERQFNPADESFIPRAFSFSHINLTHRNWTAVGRPDVPYYPIVDPRGLVTPLFDGWSIDFWLVQADGTLLLPSKLDAFRQELALGENLVLHSEGTWGPATLHTEVEMCLVEGQPHCCARARASGLPGGWLVVAVRPYNPEGVSFIEDIAIDSAQPGLTINQRNSVTFDRAPLYFALSVYKDGDVSQHLTRTAGPKAVSCPVGMATAAACFAAEETSTRDVEVRAPIHDELKPAKRPVFAGTASWADARAPLAKLRVPDPLIQRLYDAAASNLILHTGIEVYPGPYTYKRFWFRDAVFILNALLGLGDVERVRRAMNGFAPRQQHDGYFLSQEGEWDSNGEALWMFHRFAEFTGESLPAAWRTAVIKGARWISKKRLPENTGRPEAGLLPAGFSAEHLGPNDFYYWDDFWGVAGLRSAALVLEDSDPDFAADCEHEAESFLAIIENSIPRGDHRRFPGALPASPKRRMDSGAIGSIVADYPLQLFAPGDARILKTADYLRDHSSYRGGFFQNMIHSGINPYLTLHLAQVRLRAGQVEAAWALMDTVAALASPTGQWPEAIHPRTGGGCMGDGQHIWAAAEWALMVRSCFVREEGGALVIASGVKRAWWQADVAQLGPVLTPFGTVTITVLPDADGARVLVKGHWHGTPPRLEVRLPGFAPQTCHPADHEEFQIKLLP